MSSTADTQDHSSEVVCVGVSPLGEYLEYVGGKGGGGGYHHGGRNAHDLLSEKWSKEESS